MYIAMNRFKVPGDGGRPNNEGGRVMRRLVSTLLALGSTLGIAVAAPGQITIEFNDLQGADSGCRAAFVLNNGLETPLDKLALRIVAFDKEQKAKLFLTLDVGALPIGKTRILRFDLGKDVGCETIGRLVLDDVTACEGKALDPAVCLAAVSLSSRAGSPFDF